MYIHKYVFSTVITGIYTVFDHTRVISDISNNGVYTVENADVHTGKTPTCIPVNTMDSSIETYLKNF